MLIKLHNSTQKVFVDSKIEVRAYPYYKQHLFCSVHSTNLAIHCSVTPSKVVFLDNKYLQDLVFFMHCLNHLLFLDCPILSTIQTAAAVTEFLLVYPTQLPCLKRILLVC